MLVKKVLKELHVMSQFSSQVFEYVFRFCFTIFHIPFVLFLAASMLFLL
jgi:hypothetical protein